MLAGFLPRQADLQGVRAGSRLGQEAGRQGVVADSGDPF
jgi:hypothetical protein